MTLLSLVLCSRNDDFQGDPRWRLETTLNHVARQASLLGRLDDVELVVTDWGSEVPLCEVVRLTGEAARITRFVTVGLELAGAKQRDSRFAEVFALNAAARRSHGDYIGRIDQDTLVGHRFLRWFFDAVDLGTPGFPLDATVMIANRRRIPYHFACRRPPFAVVERGVELLDRRLPRMERPLSDRYWECYVGILLMHRRLWEACGGYDESFIYYSYMEFDLFLRLRMRYTGADLGPIVGDDFHHLDHVPSWLTWQTHRRVENPRRSPDDPPVEFAPNGPHWGLAEVDLPITSAPTRVPAEAARWRHREWLVLCWASVVACAGTLWFVVRDHVRLRGPARGLAHVLLVSSGVVGRLRRARASLRSSMASS
jgi:hypothetical protein